MLFNARVNITEGGFYLMLGSHCDLSIERVCLGTNMADSNRRQGRSHVGKIQLICENNQ